MRGGWAMIVGTLLVTAMTLGLSGVARAGGPKCTVAMLDGLYVFTASGFNIASSGAQPIAIVELIRFYGDGTLDAPGGTVSVNGSIFPIATPPNPPPGGSYTIQSLAAPGRGCDGAISFAAGPSLYMFVASDGKEIQMIQTN